MTNRLTALNEKEISIVSGGGVMQALDVFLNTGTALALIDLIHGTQDYFCPKDTNWVRTCEVTKTLSNIIAFSTFGWVPMIGDSFKPAPQGTPMVKQDTKIE